MKHAPLDRGFLWAKLLTDTALVGLSFLLAYGLKFKIHFISHVLFHSEYGVIYPHAQIEPYVQVLGIVTMLSILTLAMTGCYQTYRGALATLTEAIKIVKGVSITLLLLMAFSFVYKTFPGSRYVMFYFWVIASMLLLFTRACFAALYVWLHRRGVGNLNALIVGSDHLAGVLGSRIMHTPQLGYQLLGYVSPSPMEQIPYGLKNCYRYLGEPSGLPDLLRSQRVDVLMVSALGVPDTWLLDLSRQYGCRLLAAADVNYFYFNLDRIDDIPMLTLKEYPLDAGGHRMIKRVADLLGALVLMPVALPILVLSAAVIFIKEGRPIFYKQERLGRGGRVFNLLKFRTMVPNAEAATGPVYAASGDQRVTALGQFLRRSSIDELPQILNVLRGDMSLVGPRPERQYFYEAFAEPYPMFKERLRVKPGITGWAQIHGRSGLSHHIEEKLVYDLYYIDQWSWLLDFKILLKTIAVVWSQTEAY